MKQWISNGWSKFRNLVPLLDRTDLPLGAKCRVYSACTNICPGDKISAAGT